MKVFADLKLFHKLVLPFALVVATMGATVWVAHDSIDGLRRQTATIVDRYAPRRRPKVGFNRPNVRTRIFSGSGALVGLTPVMAGFGLAQLSLVGGDTISMTVLAGHVARSPDATKRLGSIRRAELRGRLDGGAKQLQEAGADTVARAVAVFKQDGIAKGGPEQRELAEPAPQSRRHEEIGQLVGCFGRSGGGVFTSLAAASGQMTPSSASLERAASDADSQATMVLHEAEQTSQAAQSVAATSGKGFAVVASEAKSLAAQTARATEQIGSQIGAMQAATVRAAEAIQGIAGTVRQANEIAMAIAGDVAQQTAATQEIARSVELVSGKTANVTESMGRVQSAVSGSSQTAAEVRNTASTLATESGSLSGEVKDFLGALKDIAAGERMLSYEMNASATATLDGRAVAGRVIRMSPGTALFAGALTASPGTAMELRTGGFSQPLRARFVGVTGEGADLQLPLTHEHLAYAARTLTRLGLRAAA